MFRKKVSPEIWQLVDSFDKISAKYEEDLETIFSSESEKKKLFFHSLREKEKAWRTSKECIMYDCSKPSIVKSHTIQKSSSLEVIAEKGHVLTPNIDRSTGHLNMSLVGINDASTFPGFCHEHELLFTEFENKKELSKAKDFMLQIYRTVCREIVIKKHINEYNSTFLERYVEFRNRKFYELMFAEAKKQGINMESFVKPGSLQFSNLDNREARIKANIKKLTKHLDKMNQDFYIPFVKHLRGGNTRQMFVWEIIQLDFVLPVCLAGIGNFGCRGENGTRNVLTVLQVLPFSDKTFVVMLVPVKHQTYLAWYINKFWANDFDVINNIESWMIHGTDHWFIKPSVWNKIKPEKQQRMLNDIRDLSKNIGDTYELDIFNDIKGELLKGI